MERNKRRKKNNIKRKIKFVIVFCFFLIFLFAVEIVNQRIVDLNCFENTNILKINVDCKTLEWFGKTYNVNIDKVKELLKDRFSGLFVLHKDFYLL